MNYCPDGLFGFLKANNIKVSFLAAELAKQVFSRASFGSVVSVVV